VVFMKKCILKVASKFNFNNTGYNFPSELFVSYIITLRVK